MESPAVEFAAPLLTSDTGQPAGDDSPAQVGTFRILHEVGRGGMGTVYLAERSDNQFRKRVALKLLPACSARNERLLRRFVDERQILATLDHPAIAHLLDGGITDDGRPWFAMEYVEGLQLDHYCSSRGLSVEARLELFCQVCDAVQYAHRNLVVHRDLKPANILVTSSGKVKLLDFGIAKLLGDDGVDVSLTLPAERMLTPLYASPEQLRGEPISTASDVYALGMLLNHLLTDTYPYRLATRDPHAVMRAILHDEPDRPSTAIARPAPSSGLENDVAIVKAAGPTRAGDVAKLARRLRGDLDTIVLTAIRKDPASRYPTVEQLEADVLRHLAGLPLMARPESPRARAHKFIRRHRMGVTVAAGVILLAIAFTAVTVLQSIRIRAEAARVTVERDRAEQVSAFLAGLFQTSDPYGGAGAAVTAREVLDSGASRITRELAGQPDARAQMMLEIGRAYFGLGLRDRAQRFVEVSLAIRRRTPSTREDALAATLDFVGKVRLDAGRLDGAERAYREALALRQTALGPNHIEVARTLNGLAGVLLASGRYRDADSISRIAVSIAERQAASHQVDLAASLTSLAHTVLERGQHDIALRLYRRALALQERSLSLDHPDAVRTLLNVAEATGRAGDTRAADSLFRRGITSEHRVLGAEHREVAFDETRYARFLHRSGRDAEAETLYRRSLATMRRKLPSVHVLTSTTLLGLGQLMLERGAGSRAEPLVREALAVRRTILPPGHPGIAEAEHAMGAVALARRRYVEAERHLLQSHAGLRRAYGDDDDRTRAVLATLIALYDSARMPARADARRAELAGNSRLLAEGAPATTPARDTTIVAVFPFRIAGTDPGLDDLRDVLHDDLTSRLDGQGAPRAVTPATQLRAAHGRGPESADNLPADAARDLARRMGARWVLRGDIAGTSHRVSVDAMLTSVGNGAIEARGHVEGSADSLPYLSHRLLADLLARQFARDSVELAAMTAASPAALRAYLAGVHATRLGRRGIGAEATTHFERALYLDSTFLLAGLRLAEIASSGGTSELDQLWQLDATWKQRERLGPADRALLHAYLGPRYPRPATLSELIDAGNAAVVAAPHRAEAWLTAGENLVRFGWKVGFPQWDLRARAALSRAQELDSTNSSTVAYLMLLAVRAGDTSAVRNHARAYAALSPFDEPGTFTDAYRWLAAAALNDSVGIDRQRRRFNEMDRRSLRAIVDLSQNFGLEVDDAGRAARLFETGATSAAQRRGVIMGIVPFLLNRGRPREAARLLATADRGFGERADVGVLEFRVFSALYWNGDSSDAAAAARSLEAYLQGAPLPLGQARAPQTAACALGHWRLAQRDIAGAEAALKEMRRLADAAGFSPVELTVLCGATLDAQLASARDLPGAGAALSRLDSLLRNGSDLQLLLPTVASLVASRLYEERGELTHALDLTRRRAFWWNQLLSTQLREEGRLAALTGDRAGAVRAYRHFLALRSDPEPSARPETERIRAELARLSVR